MFQGSMVALVTPMRMDGTIDNQSLFDLVEWHLAFKTDAIIVAGTTGESVTLSTQEQADLISTVVKQVNKRIPVIAGTGSNSTQHAIELTLNAHKAGADACLIVTPYYNKPTQNGLFEHYKAITDQCHLPIILYNVPGRTGCDLLPETVERLAKIESIIGIKEATGNLDRAAEIIKRCGKEFNVYSGDDATAMDLMLNGACGTISVTANVAPLKMHELCKAAIAGDRQLSLEINEQLMPLHKQLFLEANPIPVKWALYEMGWISSGIRLPLLPLDQKYHDDVRVAMQAAGALELLKSD